MVGVLFLNECVPPNLLFCFVLFFLLLLLFKNIILNYFSNMMNRVKMKTSFSLPTVLRFGSFSVLAMFLNTCFLKFSI